MKCYQREGDQDLSSADQNQDQRRQLESGGRFKAILLSDKLTRSPDTNIFMARKVIFLKSGLRAISEDTRRLPEKCLNSQYINYSALQIEVYQLCATVSAGETSNLQISQHCVQNCIESRSCSPLHHSGRWRWASWRHRLLRRQKLREKI